MKLPESTDKNLHTVTTIEEFPGLNQFKKTITTGINENKVANKDGTVVENKTAQKEKEKYKNSMLWKIYNGYSKLPKDSHGHPILEKVNGRHQIMIENKKGIKGYVVDTVLAQDKNNFPNQKIHNRNFNDYDQNHILYHVALHYLIDLAEKDQISQTEVLSNYLPKNITIKFNKEFGELVLTDTSTTPYKAEIWRIDTKKLMNNMFEFERSPDKTYAEKNDNEYYSDVNEKLFSHYKNELATNYKVDNPLETYLASRKKAITDILKPTWDRNIASDAPIQKEENQQQKQAEFEEIRDSDVNKEKEENQQLGRAEIEENIASEAEIEKEENQQQKAEMEEAEKFIEAHSSFFHMPLPEYQTVTNSRGKIQTDNKGQELKFATANKKNQIFHEAYEKSNMSHEFKDYSKKLTKLLTQKTETIWNDTSKQFEKHPSIYNAWLRGDFKPALQDENIRKFILENKDHPSIKVADSITNGAATKSDKVLEEITASMNNKKTADVYNLCTEFGQLILSQFPDKNPNDILDYYSKYGSKDKINSVEDEKFSKIVKQSFGNNYNACLEDAYALKKSDRETHQLAEQKANSAELAKLGFEFYLKITQSKLTSLEEKEINNIKIVDKQLLENKKEILNLSEDYSKQIQYYKKDCNNYLKHLEQELKKEQNSDEPNYDSLSLLMEKRIAVQDLRHSLDRLTQQDALKEFSEKFNEYYKAIEKNPESGDFWELIAKRQSEQMMRVLKFDGSNTEQIESYKQDCSDYLKHLVQELKKEKSHEEPNHDSMNLLTEKIMDVRNLLNTLENPSPQEALKEFSEKFNAYYDAVGTKSESSDFWDKIIKGSSKAYSHIADFKKDCSDYLNHLEQERAKYSNQPTYASMNLLNQKIAAVTELSASLNKSNPEEALKGFAEKFQQHYDIIGKRRTQKIDFLSNFWSKVANGLSKIGLFKTEGQSFLSKFKDLKEEYKKGKVEHESKHESKKDEKLDDTIKETKGPSGYQL